jgi:hypothetical protein
MEKFPRPQNGEGGWTICPKFLGSLIRSMEESDFRPCMEEAEQVLLALERLNEVVHDSDCAMHNMPAMPNGECGCIALELQKYVDSDRQKTNEINILTKENRELSAEIKELSYQAVAWMFQNDEVGRIVIADQFQMEEGFVENNPRLRLICPLYRRTSLQQKHKDAECAEGKSDHHGQDWTERDGEYLK